MAGEDQERFEDYLELEQYIEQLQAGHVAHPPAGLTPDQARIYRMAALFRSATPEASEPRPEFAAELKIRLEHEMRQSAQNRTLREKKPPRRVSRRALLSGGAAAAATLVVGAGIEHIVDHGSISGSSPVTNSLTPADPYAGQLITENTTSAWHPVMSLDTLKDEAVRFATDTIVGYIIRDSSNASNGEIIAMSAACTHMGCIVQWQNADRKFHCPCHGGIFTQDGGADPAAGRIRYLKALPRLQTKIVNGMIYVQVPVNDSTSSATPPASYWR